MTAGILFALFSLGMIKAKSKRQAVAVVLAGTIGATLLAPRRAQAQSSLISAIQMVVNVINGIIHGNLTSIQNVRTTMMQFHELTVWPKQLINQARSLATGMIGQYRSEMNGIFHLKLASATLPAPQGLEQVSRDGQTNDFSTLTTSYTSVYGPVPASTSASPSGQNMTEMDDALAEDALKTLKESDEADNITLGAANQVEDGASQATPGAAPFLTATAVVGAIESQAVMQRMMAAELRQEAGLLAHRTALDKVGASSAQQVAGALMNILR